MQVGLLLAVLATLPVGDGSVKVYRRGTSLPEFPTASTLCAALESGDKYGSWWCLKGDGAMASGSNLTLSPNGSPAQVSWPVCPSGPNCTAETMTVLNPLHGFSNDWFASSNTTPPAGSFTTCYLGWNDQNYNSAGPYAFPDHSPVSLTDVAAGYGSGNDTWKMHHGSNQKLSVYCHSVAGFDCANPVENTTPITTRQRETSLECGVFESGVRVRSCVYYPDTGLVCVDGATAKTAVDATARAWTVGRNQNDDTNDSIGFFRGAFMTEKALSDADMLRIAEATIPTTSLGTTFSRSTKAACCPDSDHCSVVSPDVPCVLGGAVRQELSGVNDVAASGFGFSSCDGSTGHSATLIGIDLVQGRFGLQTVSAASFAATGYIDVNQHYSWCHFFASTATTGSHVTISQYFKGYGGTSGTTDFCLYDGVNGSGGINGCHCTVCSFNPTTWTGCSYTYNSAALSPQILIGNLSICTGTSAAASSYYFTDLQIESATASSPSSTINTSYLGNPQGRGEETCSGTCAFSTGASSGGEICLGVGGVTCPVSR